MTDILIMGSLIALFGLVILFLTRKQTPAAK